MASMIFNWLFYYLFGFIQVKINVPSNNIECKQSHHFINFAMNIIAHPVQKIFHYQNSKSANMESNRHATEHHDALSKDSKSSCAKSQTPPKHQFKGMTLKEYFGLCNHNITDHRINQIEGESRCSSNQSIAQTPTFGLNQSQFPINGKLHKLKTEANDYEQLEMLKKENIKKKMQPICPIISHKFSQPLEIKGEQRISGNTKNHDKNDRRRMISIPSKYEQNKELQNRSTLTSFYHLHKKNKKMLTKLKSQKSKITDLKLGQAFLITKYAAKFMVNEKELLAS